MEQYTETFETWNNLADAYQKMFMHLRLYDHSYDRICSELPQHGAKILDVGCGPGIISHYLLTKRPDFDVLGIDIAPNMIALARAVNPTARFAVMDSRNIGELPLGFDAIVVGFCLPYLSMAECNNLIASAYALIQNHGLLYLSFVDGLPEQSQFKVSNKGRVYFYYHRLADVLAQLSNHRFVETETVLVPYPSADAATDTHTIVIARKRLPQNRNQTVS